MSPGATSGAPPRSAIEKRMRLQDKVALWITILIVIVLFAVKFYQGEKISARIRNS
jgi:hypothetical protein